MKRFIKIIMTISIVFLISLVNVTASTAKDIFDENAIRNFLTQAQEVKYSIKPEMGNKIIGYSDIIIYEYTGKYSTFNEAYSILSKYFNKKVAEKELFCMHVFNVNGKLGYVRASGEEGYEIEPNSAVNITINEEKRKVAVVTLIGEYGSRKDIKYTFEKINAIWIVTNEVEMKCPITISKYLTPIKWTAATATSYLKEKKIVHKPSNAIDYDETTAWVEGKQGKGINEYLLLKSSKSNTIKCVCILNGYAKNDYVYSNNNRVKKVRLEFDNGKSIIAELNDYKGYNEIKLKTPIKSKTLKITILDTFRGSKYDDTCISEVLVF